MKKGIVMHPPLDNETWRQLFVDQMRRCGADGRQVGDAWAVVAEHCIATGTSPNKAFGNPVDYARSLTGRRPSILRTLWQQAPILTGAAAFLVACWMPWVPLQHPVAVAWGSLLQVPLSLAFLVALQLVWTPMKQESAPGCIGFFLVFLVWQVATQYTRDWHAHAFTTPAWPVWALAALAMAATMVLARRGVRDRVVGPVTGTSAGAPAWAWTLLWALLPLSPAVVVLVRWLAH